MSEPKIYRKKPVEIQAMQVPNFADGEANDELIDWLGENAYLDDDCEFVIFTLEGEMHASTGDYIIRGVNGDFYPCNHDIFAKTYEEVQQ